MLQRIWIQIIKQSLSSA